MGSTLDFGCGFGRAFFGGVKLKASSPWGRVPSSEAGEVVRFLHKSSKEPSSTASIVLSATSPERSWSREAIMVSFSKGLYIVRRPRWTGEKMLERTIYLPVGSNN